MYLTSNSVLLGAEFDKIASILAFTGILGVALMRGSALLQRAVIEGLAKQALSRFFDPDVAARIHSTGHALPARRGGASAAALHSHGRATCRWRGLQSLLLSGGCSTVTK